MVRGTWIDHGSGPLCTETAFGKMGPVGFAHLPYWFTVWYILDMLTFSGARNIATYILCFIDNR